MSADSPHRPRLPLAPDSRPTAVDAAAPFLRDTVTGTGPLRLPAVHFGAAAAYLVIASLGLVLVAPELADGLFPAPAVIAVTHLFTLGVLTTTIFGALAQLCPVAFGVPLASSRAAYVAYAMFVPGVAIFAYGIWQSHAPTRDLGVALTAAGFVIAGANVAATLPRARSRGPSWEAVIIALGFLALTIALGVTLALNLDGGFLRGERVRVTTLHLHLAGIGWALAMIVGLSHRLLPMFFVAVDRARPQSRWALGWLAAGTLVWATGIVGGGVIASWIGLVLVEIGLVTYFSLVWSVFRARRRRPEESMQIVLAALLYLAVGALLAPAVLHSGARLPRLGIAYVVFGLLGGIVLFVVGMTNRIVPFLAWITRFRARVGKERVPTIAELPFRPVAVAQLVLMTAAVPLMAAGVLLGQAAVTRTGAVAFAVGAVLHAGQMAWVAWGTQG